MPEYPYADNDTSPPTAPFEDPSMSTTTPSGPADTPPETESGSTWCPGMSRVIGRLVFTTCERVQGAPIIDGARLRIEMDDGRVTAGGIALHVAGGRSGRVLVVGWIGAPRPAPARWPLPGFLTRKR